MSERIGEDKIWRNSGRLVIDREDDKTGVHRRFATDLEEALILQRDQSAAQIRQLDEYGQFALKRITDLENEIKSSEAYALRRRLGAIADDLRAIGLRGETVEELITALVGKLTAAESLLDGAREKQK